VNSNRKIVIEEFEEHDKVTFYTIRFVSDEESETEKFFGTTFDYKKFEEDIGIIGKMLDKIGEKGALENNFRHAGKSHDNVGALPDYLYVNSKLRLYAIKLTERLVILGNGGYKTTKTYNEDPHLNDCVELLIKIDRYLRSRIDNGSITLYKQQIFGNLKFTVK